MANNMKKLLLLLGFLSVATLLFGWTGSDITCQLKYPKGSGATTRMYLPSATYGIVKNGLQAVDYHFVQLYNNTTAVTPDIQTWCTAHVADIVFTDTVEDRNALTEERLLSGVLLRQGANSVVFGKRYVMILRAKDMSGLWAVDWAYVYFLPREGE